jgi:uncharacterized membrane protein
MDIGIANLALAVVFFVGIHAIPAVASARSAAVKAVGENAFRGIFSLVSAAGLIWVIWAYKGAPALEPMLWTGGAAARYVALVLMAIAFVLFVCALSAPNPTSAGGEKLLKKGDAAHGIFRVTRHPLMWSFGLWGAAHLINRTDPASLWLFGGMTLLALTGTMMIDGKKKRLFPEQWDGFAAVTSNVPFAAIIARRNKLDIGEIGWWRIVLGLVIWALVAFWGHEWAGGMATLPY